MEVDEKFAVSELSGQDINVLIVEVGLSFAGVAELLLLMLDVLLEDTVYFGD